MNRRDFIKSSLFLAALAPFASHAAAAEDSSAGGGAPGGAPAEKKVGGVTRRAFKNTNVTFPLLGFGTMRLPVLGGDTAKIDVTRFAEMVDRALAAGVNYFDTAYPYHRGESENACGEVLSKYPRDSFMIASKMNMRVAKSAADVERIFAEQLKKCRVEYFDNYLLHAVSSNLFDIIKSSGVVKKLEEFKAAGKIRRLGFSFHDTPEVLKEVIKWANWDFAQIQLNYYDWESYRSREQYEILTAAGIPIIVMEPIRGGALAKLPDKAASHLTALNPGASHASWALRYCASLPNVLCVLSGMSTSEQVDDNLKTFSPFVPLTNAERDALARALFVYKGGMLVPCTACNYCQPCPVGVEIPTIFGLYNQFKADANRELFKNAYKALKAGTGADACVACQACVRKCPQHINIPAELAKIAAEVAKK